MNPTELLRGRQRSELLLLAITLDGARTVLARLYLNGLAGKIFSNRFHQIFELELEIAGKLILAAPEPNPQVLVDAAASANILGNTWRLRARDLAAADVGYINSWSITF